MESKKKVVCIDPRYADQLRYNKVYTVNEEFMLGKAKYYDIAEVSYQGLLANRFEDLVTDDTDHFGKSEIDSKYDVKRMEIKW